MWFWPVFLFLLLDLASAKQIQQRGWVIAPSLRRWPTHAGLIWNRHEWPLWIMAAPPDKHLSLFNPLVKSHLLLLWSWPGYCFGLLGLASTIHGTLHPIQQRGWVIDSGHMKPTWKPKTKKKNFIVRNMASNGRQLFLLLSYGCWNPFFFFFFFAEAQLHDLFK